MVDNLAEEIADVRQQCLRFLEVADDVFPGLRPAALRSFLQRIKQLRKRLDLGCGLGRVLCQRQYLFNFVRAVAGGQQFCAMLFLGGFDVELLLSLGVAFHGLGFFLEVPAHLLERRRQHIRSQPTLTEAFPERAGLLDDLAGAQAHGICSARQRLLKQFAAHAGIDHGVPVHQPDRAGRDGL